MDTKWHATKHKGQAVGRRSFKMIKPIFFLLLVVTIGCGQKPEKRREIILTQTQTDNLLINWKRDSVGCLRLRDPEMMLIYAKHLIGKDSIEIVRQLGPPNAKYSGGGRRHFQYFLECGDTATSYYNFNFHFSQDTLDWFSNPVH
jgi:hypothetical protein